MFVFPRLEELVLIELPEDDENVCDELLQAVRLRSLTSPIKRLALDYDVVPKYILHGFAEKLNYCVDAVEWL